MVILEDLDKFLTQKKNLKANHIMAGLCLSKYLYCNGQILQGKGDTAMASETKYNTCVAAARSHLLQILEDKTTAENPAMAPSKHWHLTHKVLSSATAMKCIRGTTGGEANPDRKPL